MLLLFVSKLDDFLQFHVAFVWNCFAISIEQISVDVPILLWVISKKLLLNKLIEAYKLLP